MATFNFVCICLHVASHRVWIDGSLFLHQFQRGIKAIQGDGNCLFRSLASIICSNEERHQHVRRLLVTFCRHNTKHFQTFCHPVPIEQHINGMEQDRVWGTDLEIHAAAALWQVQIYVCTPDISSTSPSYSWIYFKPAPITKIILPTQCEELPRPPGVFHFELFHAWGCHYDVIVGPDGHLPLNPPPIPQPQASYITL